MTFDEIIEGDVVGIVDRVLATVDCFLYNCINYYHYEKNSIGDNSKLRAIIDYCNSFT